MRYACRPTIAICMDVLSEAGYDDTIWTVMHKISHCSIKQYYSGLPTVSEYVVSYSELNYTNWRYLLYNSEDVREIKLIRNTHSGSGSQQNCWVSQSKIIVISTECKATPETVRRKGYVALVTGLLHNKQVTTWNRILLKKLISRLASEATPRLVWNTKLYCRIHKNPSTGPIGNTPEPYSMRLTSVNALITYFFEIYFNINLPSTTTSPKGFLPSDLPANILFGYRCAWRLRAVLPTSGLYNNSPKLTYWVFMLLNSSDFQTSLSRRGDSIRDSEMVPKNRWILLPSF
jgi:hypothetical protein